MNIKDAKEQIKNAVIAYGTKDEFGRPEISVERQRPVFLVGAPGIGKTAIVDQIAKELGIGLVTYSITHHTRQSALGLPYISEKDYRDGHYRVSEYTMSEIIASVYDKMEETGVDRGILFLDEINCVSETLMPAMLQFLQYKVFGQHRVPEGWIVITAGNPPEYNSSVREFDMVTSDRLKRIDIEPDYEAWKEWADGEDIHRSVLTYLDIKKDDFYSVETTVDGRKFVTPRGWTDLSDMMRLYEKNGLECDEKLIRQYIQDDDIAGAFSTYYELWKKYRSDYRIGDIAAGCADEVIMNRAKAASFDERISLIGLLMDHIRNSMEQVMNRRKTLLSAKDIIAGIKDKEDAYDLLQERLEWIKSELTDEKAQLLEEEKEKEKRRLLKYFNDAAVRKDTCVDDIIARYRDDVGKLNEMSDTCSAELENVFAFLEEAFGAGPEIQLVMTELTSSGVSAKYIGQYGSESYYRYNKELLFYERQKELTKEIEEVLDI